MSYTEHPDIDAARHMEEEERKALELEWLIEEESKKECYNPYTVQSIIETLYDLTDDQVASLESILQSCLVTETKLDSNSCLTFVDNLTFYSENYQEKRIRENVMKGK